MKDKRQDLSLSSIAFPATKKALFRGIIFFLVFIAFSLSAIFFVKKYVISDPKIVLEGTDNSEQVEGDRYQAVFLDNGQVYFGKLVRQAGDFYRLENVFYFKQNPQTPGASKPPEQNVSLLRLGSEAHGPEDFMEINKSHIIFIEDLKEESPVVKAITEYTEKKIE